MKKEILGMFILGIFLFSGIIGVAASNPNVESLGVELSVNFEEKLIGLQIPSAVELPVVTNGYSSSVNMEIYNIGTADVSLTAELQGVDYYSGIEDANEDDYNVVFDELALRISNGYFPIQEFQETIEMPTTIGGTRKEILSLNLDLKNYFEPIDLLDNRVYIVFTAIPA